MAAMRRSLRSSIRTGKCAVAAALGHVLETFTSPCEQRTSSSIFYAPEPPHDLWVVDNYAQNIRVISATNNAISLAASTAAAFAVSSETVDYSKPTLAVTTVLSAPRGVVRGRAATDSLAMFIVDSVNLVILRLDPDGVLSLVAGSGALCGPDTTAACGDGGPATAAAFNFPIGITARANGDLIIADYLSSRVRAVVGRNGSSPTVVTLAGTGEYGSPTPGAQARAAQIASPLGVALDPETDEVLFGDDNCAVWRVCGPHCKHGAPGELVPVVGVLGDCSFPPPGLNNTPLAGVTIGVPAMMAVGPTGLLYVGDQVRGGKGRGRLHKPQPCVLAHVQYYSCAYAVNLTSGTISYFAGRPWVQTRPVFTTPPPGGGPATQVAFGDGRPAIQATFNYIFGVAVDFSTGNVFFSDYVDQLVRRIRSFSRRASRRSSPHPEPARRSAW